MCSSRLVLARPVMRHHEVFDLGVMVPCEKILERARAEHADLIGLSGLITPSLDEMTRVAQEMQRQGFRTPLLIGGATTSKAHTAVKIAPHYEHPVVHVLDASRAVPVTSSLLSESGREVFVKNHAAEYEKLRREHGTPNFKLLSLDAARANRPLVAFDANAVAVPEFTGVRVLDDFPLDALREYIDWTPFFRTWELKGAYPRIFDDAKYGEQAKQIFEEANQLLDRVIAEKWLVAKGIYALFPANSVGDDVELYTDHTRTAVLARFHFLRQQREKSAGQPHFCLSDLVAPK